MEPEIQIWDLDVVNTIEPAYVLTGQRKKKKKKVEHYGSICFVHLGGLQSSKKFVFVSFTTNIQTSSGPFHFPFSVKCCLAFL